MKILFITPYLPSLIRVRSFNFIKFLARKEHQLHVISLIQDKRELSKMRNLKNKLGVDGKAILLPRWKSYLNCFFNLPTLLPLQVSYCLSKEMKDRIEGIIESNKFDIIHVESLRAAGFLPGRKTTPPILFDAIDCISYLYQKFQKNSTDPINQVIFSIEAARLPQYEISLLNRYKNVVVTSKFDKSKLQILDQTADIQVITNGVDFDYFKPTLSSEPVFDLIFTGKISYYANELAIRYLAHQILPRVWKRRPQTTLGIVGSSPSNYVKKLGDNPKIAITGFVSGLRTKLANSLVSVAPIIVGTGIQNKILEAMACRIPVVCTPIAARSLDVATNIHLMVAENPDQFADRIIELLQNKKLRQQIAANAYNYVRIHHDWKQKTEELEKVYERVLKNNYRK